MAYVGGPNPNQPLDPSAETAAGQRQRWAFAHYPWCCL